MISVAFVARGELTDGLGTHCRDSQGLSGTGQADSAADGGARGRLGWRGVEEGREESKRGGVIVMPGGEEGEGEGEGESE